MDNFLKVFIGILLTLALILLSSIVYFVFLETDIDKKEVEKSIESPVKKSVTDNQEAIEKSHENRQERIEALKQVGKELSGN